MSTSSPPADALGRAPVRARAALGHIARIAFGLVFLGATVIKSIDPALFQEQIVEFGVTPAAWATWQAPLFIALEWILGVALVVNFRPRFTIPAAMALMLVFVTALVLAIRGGYTGSCGCFGGASTRGPTDALIEDALFLALGVVAWVGLRTPPGLSGRGRRTWQAMAVLFAIVIGVSAPTLGPSLPIPAFATSARVGTPFDHVILEEFDGDLHTGRYVLVIVDPEAAPSDEFLSALDALSRPTDRPPVIGAFPGDNEAMVTYLFEYAPAFDGAGHAPRAALRRFFRRLPVVLALDSGVIRGAWHEVVPGDAEIKAAFAAS